jgi:hypothetical protein
MRTSSAPSTKSSLLQIRGQVEEAEAGAGLVLPEHGTVIVGEYDSGLGLSISGTSRPGFHQGDRASVAASDPRCFASSSGNLSRTWAGVTLLETASSFPAPVVATIGRCRWARSAHGDRELLRLDLFHGGYGRMPALDRRIESGDRHGSAPELHSGPALAVGGSLHCGYDHPYLLGSAVA